MSKSVSKLIFTSKWKPYLKADISAVFITKLMNHMKVKGIAKVVPRLDPEGGIQESNFRGGHFNGGLTSSYFTRHDFASADFYIE